MSNAAVQASAIRTHWGIENNVHWVLDVSFKEDASRNYLLKVLAASKSEPTVELETTKEV